MKGEKLFPKHEGEEPLAEKPEAEVETSQEIIETLRAHIVDIEPAEIGRSELIKKISDTAVGAVGCLISRSEPPIQVESATVSRGKTKVLFGPNGAGKSTLFDAFMERGADFNTQSGRGAVVFGRPVHVREKLRIARLDQEELLGKVDEMTARAVLLESAAFFKSEFPIDWDKVDLYDENLKNQDAQVRIDALISQITTLFEMAEFLDTKTKHLSGGERTKLALFMILSSEPDALLLDEPTNHLDLKSIAKLTGLFDQYKKADTAILSVSHVEWFLEEAGADGVLEIVWNEKGRKVRESGAAYSQYVKDASRERVPIISGDIKWLQKDYGYKQGLVLVAAPRVFTIPESPLKNVSLPNIQGGELIIVSGDNGTGKTKIMETIKNNNREDLPSKQKGAQIAYLPQFWPEEIDRGTLGDFFYWVKENTSPHSTGSAYHKDQPPQKLFIERARELNFGGASRIGESWLQRPFARFSGGEQRLLWFLATSALRDVDMLMLDEPTNHMDRDLQARVTRAIQTFPGAILLSTHDRNLMSILSKDAGAIRGISRTSKHLVLEKSAGTTTIESSKESPIEYMERLLREARQEAKKVKI